MFASDAQGDLSPGGGECSLFPERPMVQSQLCMGPTPEITLDKTEFDERRRGVQQKRERGPSVLGEQTQLPQTAPSTV